MTTAEPARVIVGVDASARSVRALRWAAPVARALNATVEVTTAWQYPSGAAPITIDASTLEREALELTHRVAADAFPEEAPAGLTFSAVMGPTIRVLEEASRRAALLVIGSRGYGSVRGALLGSVSRVLAASSHCPILIYHDADGGTEPA